MGKKSKKPTSASLKSTTVGSSNESQSAPQKQEEKTEEVVPMEVSEEEYQDLITQAAELTIEEAQTEWLQCARYGELDALRAMLDRFPTLMDHSDSQSANTALHMAAANGHLSVVKFLIIKNHTVTKNNAGNTPLHWAASNGQAAVVEYLTTHEKLQIDVLEKNEFGRSALTEGFTSQKEQVVKALLEHDSATEERLLATSGGKATSIVHSLFDKERPLLVRELAMANADNPFADSDRPDQDTTGFSIWSASLILARWMATKTWSNESSLLELGAGCGVPALAVAISNPAPHKVYITDLNPETVDNAQYNVKMNNVQEHVQAIRIDWEDKSTWPNEPLDCVIGSDLIYQAFLVPLLTSVILGLLKPGGTFYYVAPDTGRDGLEEFVQEMKAKCPDWKEQVAPKEYHDNPLTNDDDEECFLHFQELSSLTYMLYEFTAPMKE